MIAKEERLQQLVALIQDAGKRADQDRFIQQEPAEQTFTSRRHLWKADALYQGEMIQEI